MASPWSRTTAAAWAAGATAAVAVGAAVVLLQRQKRGEGSDCGGRSAAAANPRVSAEDVARNPGRATLGARGTPALPSWGSGGEDTDAVYFLKSPPGGLTQRLYRHSLRTGKTEELLGADHVQEETLSEEEKQRRERMRQMSTGVTRYEWAASAGTDGQPAVMLVPAGNDLYVSRDGGRSFQCVLKGSTMPGAVVGPTLSSDGSLVGFVCDAEVYITGTRLQPSLSPAPPVQVTSGARGTSRTHGLANYIAQEEMDRLEGFWISPSGQFLAFEESDDSHIPAFRIMHSGKPAAVGAGAQEDLRYPFAGEPNPRSRLGIASIGEAGGAVVWMDTSPRAADLGAEPYLARVFWLPAAEVTTTSGSKDRLLAVLQNREQTKLVLVEYTLSTGQATCLISETSPPNAWVNLATTDNLRPLGPNGSQLLWGSERTGFQHLYLLDVSPGLSGGRQLVPLTSGQWMVDGVVPNGVNKKRGKVYFLGNRDDPLEKQLYEVDLSQGPGSVRRVTTEPGTHSCVVDSTGTRFIDTWSSIDAPYRVAIKSIVDGSTIQVLYDAREAVATDLARLELAQPKFSKIKSRDGQVDLHLATYLPDPKTFGSGPYPLLVSCYGGPHVQFVRNSWEMTTADMRAQALLARGYAVLKVDNRGSARRGLAFEAAIKGNMGDLEVQDQAAGVDHLVAKGIAIPGRVGIYGWSYGGYLSAISLARGSETFNLAVAGAPVTSWDGYDTHYTERYMMTPQTNPTGYEASSVMTHAEKIRGKLLLVHGLVDENVHFRHTARLIDTLIKKQVPHQLLLFPNERHMPRSVADRVFMENRILEFIEANL